MASSTQDFQSHRVWESARQCAVAAGLKRPLEQGDLDRLKVIAATSALCLSYASTQPHLLGSTWPAMLEKLASNFEEVQRQLEGWDDSAAMPAVAYEAVDTHMDAALNRLRLWSPTLNVTSRARQVVEIATAFEAASEARLSAIEAKATAIATSIDDGSTDLTALTSAIDAQETRITNSEAALAGTLNSLVEDAKRDLAAELAAANLATEAELKAGRDAFQSTNENLTASVKTTVDEIDLQAGRAKELVAIIGGEGVSAGYFKYAEAQQRSAFWWSLAAVVLGIAAIGFLGWVLWDFRDEPDPSPAMLALKGAVTVSGFTIAGYMTRIGAHHRAQAVKARFRSLDMHALGPYSENLDPLDKQKLMMHVGRSIFANEDDGTAKGEILNAPKA